MGGEEARTCCQRAIPAASGCVDVPEGLGGGGARDRVVRVADAGEDAAGFGFTGRRVVARFEAEKSVFEREMKVRGFETHGFAELLASGFAVAGFQQRVGEILADVGAIRRERRGLFEK